MLGLDMVTQDQTRYFDGERPDVIFSRRLPFESRDDGTGLVPVFVIFSEGKRKHNIRRFLTLTSYERMMDTKRNSKGL